MRESIKNVNMRAVNAAAYLYLLTRTLYLAGFIEFSAFKLHTDDFLFQEISLKAKYNIVPAKRFLFFLIL